MKILNLLIVILSILVICSFLASCQTTEMPQDEVDWIIKNLTDH